MKMGVKNKKSRGTLQHTLMDIQHLISSNEDKVARPSALHLLPWTCMHAKGRLDCRHPLLHAACHFVVFLSRCYAVLQINVTFITYRPSRSSKIHGHRLFCSYAMFSLNNSGNYHFVFQADVSRSVLLTPISGSHQ